MKDSVRRINKQIELLQKRLDKIQYKCQHKNKRSISKANTGNLDYNNYWTENECLDCGLFWRSDEKEVLAY